MTASLAEARLTNLNGLFTLYGCSSSTQGGWVEGGGVTTINNKKKQITHLEHHPESLKVAVSAIEAEFVCPICQCPAENAVQLKSCGHFFCQTCCEDLVSRRFTECVAAGCRVPFRRLDIMPSHTTRNILDMCNHFKL